MTAATAELTKGAFIRVQLPGKHSRRSYRVERVEGGAVELLELWQRDADDVWTPGDETRIASIERLEKLEIRGASAPIPGTATPYS